MRTIKEVAEELGMSRQGVNKWIEKLHVTKYPAGKTSVIQDIDFQRIKETRAMSGVPENAVESSLVQPQSKQKERKPPSIHDPTMT